MNVSKKIAVALSLAMGSALAVGAVVPAQAVTRVPAHAAHAGKSHTPTDPDAIVELSAPTFISGDNAFTIKTWQRLRYAGTLQGIHFSGTGVPGDRVTVTYAPTKDAKGPLLRGFAGIVRVNKHGNWQMEASFSYADITRDPTTGEKRLEYHPVETGDDFDERGRYRGYIPLGY